MQRFGRRHRPFYRINAIEKRNRRNGRVIENLGWYDPIARDESKQVELKAERIQHWLEHGAQPSETVETLLANADLLPEKRRKAWEERRATDKARVVSKTAVAKAEAALAAIGEMDAEADVGSFKSAAEAAVKSARDAVSRADIDGAQKAQADAEAALANAKKADEDAKARKAEEEAKAAAEAKAAEEAAAESSDEAAEEEKSD